MQIFSKKTFMQGVIFIYGKEEGKRCLSKKVYKHQIKRTEYFYTVHSRKVADVMNKALELDKQAEEYLYFISLKGSSKYDNSPQLPERDV